MATIQGVYVALFGRPADPAGLAYFNAATSNGANLTAIGDLAATAEYQDRFDGMNNIAVINTIYQGLFGRDADAAGLSFFVAALQSGSLNINNIAIAILDGAQGDDALIVANKLVAANAFTAAVDTTIEIASYSGSTAAASGVSFLAGITSDVATIPDATETTDAVKAVVDAGVAGNTLASFIDGAGNVSTSAAAAFQTTNNNDTITVTAYTSASTINGGFGTDTLNVTLATAVAPTAAEIVSIEKLFVTSTNAIGALNLTDVAGVTEVWNNASTAALAVSGIDTNVAIGVKGTVVGTTTFTFDDVAGTADTAKLVLDTAAAGTVTVAGIETLNVATSGVSSVSGLTAADATTVTITGAGQLTLGGSFHADATVDASAHTGKFIFTSAGDADGLTVIGGASNDTFNVTTDGEGVHLTGGAGSDLFNIGSLTNIDSLVAADITKDVITITDFNGSADTLDFGGDLGVAVALTNVQLNNITSAATLVDALTAAGTASAVGGVESYVEFQYSGSTYIYHDVAGDGFTVGDGLIQLVGFTGDLTATNFVA